MAVVETSDVPSILIALVPRARVAKQGIRNLDLDEPFGWRQDSGKTAIDRVSGYRHQNLNSTTVMTAALTQAKELLQERNSKLLRSVSQLRVAPLHYLCAVPPSHHGSHANDSR